MSTSRILIVLIGLICAIFYPFQFASSAVSIDFGTPVVPDQSLGPVPIGDFSSTKAYNAFFFAASDHLNLMLVNTPWAGVWSMVRVTPAGQVVDTIPRQFRSPENQSTAGMKAVTWSTPYFYIWEALNGYIYVSRLTEDLTLVDQSPRQVGRVWGGVAFGENVAWTFQAYPAQVWAYNGDTGEPLFASATISGWRPMSGVYPAGRVNDGLYLYRRNPLDVTMDFAYISPTGQVQVLASYPGLDFPGGSALYSSSSDSVLYWAFHANGDGSWVFNYNLVSPADSLSPRSTHSVNLPSQPARGFQDITVAVAGPNRTALIAGRYWNEFYREFVAAVDLRSDSLLSFQWLDYRGYSLGRPAISVLPDTTLLLLPVNDGIEATPLLGSDLSTISQHHPILYGLGHQGRPSLIRDSCGLLIYVSNGTAAGAGVSGYRWSNPIASNLENPAPIALPSLDSAVTNPYIFDYDGGRGLFWKEKLDSPIDTIPSNFNVLRLSLFQGVAPTPGQVASAFTFDTVNPGLILPPSAQRIGDLLYFSSNSGDGWKIHKIDLTDGTTVPIPQKVWTYSTNLLLNHADTLYQLGMLQYCANVQPPWCSPNLLCCLYNDHLLARGFVDTTRVLDYNGDFVGTFEYALFLPTLHATEIDGKCFVTADDPPVISRVDLTTHTITPVLDITSQLTQPINSFTEPETYLVPFRDHRLIFYFRHDGNPNEVFVFDSTWQLLDKETIPMAGWVLDIGGVTFSSDSSKLILVYSSFLPYPYSSERLVLQTMGLDQATDVNDGTATPGSFRLTQNYPNPFNPSTTIEYSLPRRSHVTIEIYNMLGQKVNTVVDREESAGDHSAVWDGLDASGNSVATGIYLYRLKAGDRTETKKMVLLK